MSSAYKPKSSLDEPGHHLIRVRLASFAAGTAGIVIDVLAICNVRLEPSQSCEFDIWPWCSIWLVSRTGGDAACEKHGFAQAPIRLAKGCICSVLEEL
jgi:hypothetical protein